MPVTRLHHVAIHTCSSNWALERPCKDIATSLKCKQIGVSQYFCIEKEVNRDNNIFKEFRLLKITLLAGTPSCLQRLFKIDDCLSLQAIIQQVIDIVLFSAHVR